MAAEAPRLAASGAGRALCRRGRSTRALIGFLVASACFTVLGDAPVGDTVLCPEGYYRGETLVFGCLARSGQAYIVVPGASDQDSSGVEAVFRIPPGVLNLRVSAEGGQELGMSVEEANAEEGGRLQLDGDIPVRWGNATVRYRSSGSGTAAEDVLSVFGRSPGALRIRLSQTGVYKAVATVGYSHDGAVNVSSGANASSLDDDEAGHCHLEVPYGCERFDERAVRAELFRWSSWARQVYKTSADAWVSLCQASMEVVEYSRPSASSRRLLADGPVPFYVWPYVWRRWPGAKNGSNVSWQAIFDFVDSLGVKDKYVEQKEFVKAYGWAEVYPSLQLWCNSLHKAFHSAADAYASLAGADRAAGIFQEAWQDRVWASFDAPPWLSKAKAEDVFAYVDANGNDVISKTELMHVWNSCQSLWPFNFSNGTGPASRPSTPHLRPLKRGEAWHYAAYKCGRPADSQQGAELKSANKTATVLCCAEGGSSCASPSSDQCLTGRTLKQAEEACRKAGRRLCHKAELESGLCCGGAGCNLDTDLVWSSTMAGGSEGSGEKERKRRDVQRPAVCLGEGLAYWPPMQTPGLPALEPDKASVPACQARCVAEPGCYHFTFWEFNASCLLHDHAASWSNAPGAIAGPAVCSAAVKVHISGVDFSKLKSEERDFLSDGFVQDLASASGLPVALIKNPARLPATVALSAGSLVANARVELPPGRSISDAAKVLDSQDLRYQFTRTVAAANLTQFRSQVGPKLLSVANVNISVLGSSEDRCFVQGTKYEPSIPGVSSVWAANVSQCQQHCRASQECRFFTFWPAVEGCLLQNGSAVPVHDPNTTAGPKECPPAPSNFPEPADSELQLSGAGGSWLAWLRTRPDLVALWSGVALVPAVLLCVYAIWLNRKPGRRRGPNSRKGDPDYHAVSTDYAVMHEQGSGNRGLLAANDDEVPSWATQCAEAAGGPPRPLASDSYASAQQGSPAVHTPFLYPEHIGINVQAPQGSHHVTPPPSNHVTTPQAHMPWPYPSHGQS